MEDLLIKAATVIAVALAAFSSFPSPAQQDQQTQQSTASVRPTVALPQELAMFQEPTPPAQPQTQEPAAPQTQPSQPNVRTVQLQLITGELDNKLDSTSARQGDSVVLKTREGVKTPDGTEIPKGSKLVGHVINVRPRSNTAENAQITLQFDRAELKGGQSLPIESVLESVAPSAGESTMDNNGGMAPMQPATGAAGSAPGSAPGSARGSAPGSAAATTGTPTSPADNNGTNQSAANDHPGLASGSTAQTPDQNVANGAPGSIVARSGNVAIRTTSIPGVLLANNVDGQPFSNASGMLLGARRDIKLDGGTQIVVAVATAPQQGSGMPR